MIFYKADLLDKVFTNLTVVEELQDRYKGSVVWRCICACGNEVTHTSKELNTGKFLSCGCLEERKRGLGKRTHGASDTTEYNSWSGAKGRCYNQNDPAFVYYGGRGIKMSDDWLNSFENFIRDMGPAPEGHSLDRINPNGDYCKENCRWADNCLQMFNQRRKRTNKSGRTGVSWSEERQRWVVTFSVNGKRKSLGRFKTFEEACKVREDAEMEYMGFTKE